MGPDDPETQFGLTALRSLHHAHRRYQKTRLVATRPHGAHRRRVRWLRWLPHGEDRVKDVWTFLGLLMFTLGPAIGCFLYLAAILH